MSLQVWIPALDGSYRHQGFYNTTIQGNASNNASGKLGRCISFNGNSQYIEGTYPAKENITFALWLYLPTLPTGNHVFDARNNDIGYQPMYLTSNSIQIGCNERGFEYINYSWAANTWYHVCVTHNATEGCLYVNGSLIGTSSIAKGYNYNSNIKFNIGSRWNQGTYSNIYVNDVRIYDECLSAERIKKLARGLIMYYPLNRQGFGGDDLSKFLSNDSGSIWNEEEHSITSITTTNTNLGSAIAKLQYWNGTDNYLGQPHSSTKLGYNEWTIEKTSNWNNLRVGINGNKADACVRFDCSSLPNGIYTFSFNLQSLSADAYGNGGKLIDCKLEKGSKGTMVMPKIASGMARTLGVDTTFYELDKSGFNNHGRRIGTFSYSSDTPKLDGSVSTYFNGVDNVIIIPYDTNALQSNFTMNIWFKKTKLGSKNYETLIGGPPGFEMDTRAGAATDMTLYMASTRGGNITGNGFTNFSFNEWHMVTLVSRDSGESYYVDGELIKTISKYSMPAGEYYIGAWRDLVSQNYEGLLRDCRIYATALSAADVKELYDNKE